MTTEKATGNKAGDGDRDELMRPLANEPNDRTARVLRAEREVKRLLARADRLIAQAAHARERAGAWHEKAERLDAQARDLEATANLLVTEASGDA